jgi:hypothetical protein
MLWITGVKDSIAKLCIYVRARQTNRPKGKQMTAIEQAVQEAVGIASLSEADKLRVDLESQQIIIQGLRTTINNHRNQVRDLYTMLNDTIQDGGCEETSNITFGELSEILKDVFGSELVFTKEYEVQVRYTVYASFKVTAASEEDARSVAEEIGISADIEWDIDTDNTEVDTWSIDDTRIEYIQEA